MQVGQCVHSLHKIAGKNYKPKLCIILASASVVSNNGKLQRLHYCPYLVTSELLKKKVWSCLLVTPFLNNLTYFPSLAVLVIPMLNSLSETACKHNFMFLEAYMSTI